MTTNNFSNLAYELINDKYSKAKYLGIECIMETKTGFINAPKFCTAASDGKKRFDNYLRLDRYINLIKYMESSPQFRGELSIQVTSGNYELWGTYVHPDLLLDLASWISPAAYIKASGIVRNFLVREKEDEIIRLSRDKSRLEKMFEESDKRREEAEKRAEQMMLEMTLQTKEALLQNKETHVKLDETKIILQETHFKLDKTHVKLDKTKIALQRVEARVDILVEEVVPPAKKVSLHEQFGIMKLNDSEGKREYKVYCVQTRGVCKARASILKEYPKAVLIKEVNPNANAKNFLHKLKEKYGTGKKAKMSVSYNFINLKGCKEDELVKMIDEVVGEAKNFGV